MSLSFSLQTDLIFKTLFLEYWENKGYKSAEKFMYQRIILEQSVIHDQFYLQLFNFLTN